MKMEATIHKVGRAIGWSFVEDMAPCRGDEA